MLTKINLETLGMASPAPHVFVMMTDISEESCQTAIEWILNANLVEEADRPDVLTMMICSNGGDFHAAVALIEVMRGSSIPIQTIGLGQIASAGLLIFMAGTKGMRVITENTSIMSHRYSTGMIGKSHELLAAQKEHALTTKRMIGMYVRFTGLDEDTINKYLLPPQDVFLDSEEAIKYGIADIVKDLG